MSPEQIKEFNRNFLLGACHNLSKRTQRLGEAKDLQVATLKQHGSIDKVYDVGAASGFFMKAVEDAGGVAHGNEISMASIAWAKKEYGINIAYGFLEELEIPDSYFDAVVLWNTLEHTSNPKTTLDVCYRVLKEGGLIYIKVPNHKSPNELINFYEGAHLFEFTEECLSIHLKDIGFKEIFVDPKDVDPRCNVTAAVYLYRK